MEYRTYHKDLCKTISASIEPSISIIDVWKHFKNCTKLIISNLSDDIQDYGLAIEFYKNSLYINIQIANSNNGFDFMEQAGVAITYLDNLEVDKLALDLWKENGYSLEEMFKEFENDSAFKKLTSPIGFDMSFVSGEL